MQAIRTYGMLEGSVLAAWRLLRCNPWSRGGFDPVEDQTLFRTRTPRQLMIFADIANILQPLIDVCEAIMVFFHDQVGFSWGMSIIVLTVVIRLLILPLTFSGVKACRRCSGCSRR